MLIIIYNLILSGCLNVNILVKGNNWCVLGNSEKQGLHVCMKCTNKIKIYIKYISDWFLPVFLSVSNCVYFFF